MRGFMIGLVLGIVMGSAVTAIAGAGSYVTKERWDGRTSDFRTGYAAGAADALDVMAFALDLGATPKDLSRFNANVTRCTGKLTLGQLQAFADRAVVNEQNPNDSAAGIILGALSDCK